MPPNLSKVLYHWGMEKDVLKIGLKSAGIELILCEYRVSNGFVPILITSSIHLCQTKPGRRLDNIHGMRRCCARRGVNSFSAMWVRLPFQYMIGFRVHIIC